MSPSTATKFTILNLEDEECVCSLGCEGHTEEEAERDECVCTVTYKGVQTHICTGPSDEDIDYEMGIKYCPGIEPVLPTYNYVS